MAQTDVDSLTDDRDWKEKVVLVSPATVPADGPHEGIQHDYQDVADSLRERIRMYLQEVEGENPEIRTFDVPGYHDLAMRSDPVRFGYRNQSGSFE